MIWLLIAIAGVICLFLALGLVFRLAALLVRLGVNLLAIAYLSGRRGAVHRQPVAEPEVRPERAPARLDRPAYRTLSGDTIH